MRFIFRSIGLISLLVAPIASIANASPVMLISDTRSVSWALIEPDPFGGGYNTYAVYDAEPDPAFSRFDVGGFEVNQDSTVGPLLFQSTGSGYSYDNGVGNTNYAYSTFSIDFEVTAPTETSISGSLGSDGGRSTFLLWNRGDGAGTVYSESSPLGSRYSDPVSQLLSWDGILQPGHYQVYALAAGEDGGGHHDFAVTFSPGAVPEPSTGLLLLLGLGLLGGTRGRGPSDGLHS